MTSSVVAGYVFNACSQGRWSNYLSEPNVTVPVEDLFLEVKRSDHLGFSKICK